MTWLQAYMPTLRHASSFLFDLIDPAIGLINAPGSLYIDVFIRGNFTSDSNAMAVTFFREFAAAEACVGNSSGAAALLALADDIKDKMNVAKKREAFRPFAPVIIEELAGSYFDILGQDHSYMQYTVRCKDPDSYPGIVHVDGTSRLQTVNRQQHRGLWELLVRWYNSTECPMLVNTSLNIKGQPLVNSEADAEAFTSEYGIPVFCRD